MNLLETITQAKEDINEILEDLIDTIVAGFPVDSKKVTKNRLTKIKTNGYTNKIKPSMTSSDKKVIIGLFKRGKDTPIVSSKFPQYSTGQLAAIKAHVTMGTY